MSKPSLLIVDDSRMSRLMISKFISELRPDWEIQEAASGDEAVDKVDQEIPALISMDMNMPGIIGLEAASLIQAKHPDIKIVICTANVQGAMRDSTARAGFSFVEKPITHDSVSRIISFFEE